MHPSFFTYSLFRAVFWNSSMLRKNTRHERGGEKQKVFSTLEALFKKKKKKKHKILLSFFLSPFFALSQEMIYIILLIRISNQLPFRIFLHFLSSATTTTKKEFPNFPFARKKDSFIPYFPLTSPISGLLSDPPFRHMTRSGPAAFL